MKKINSYQWKVLFLAISINLTLGVIYGWSELRKSIIYDLGWSNGEAKLPFIITIITFTIGAIIGGRFQDKRNPAKVLFTGAIIFGLGFILSGFIQNFFSFFVITIGIICGTGMGLCFSVSIPIVIKSIDKKRKGLFVGLVVSGLGLAPLYMDIITNRLMSFFGINKTFIILGLISVLILVILSIILKFSFSNESAFKEDLYKSSKNEFGWKSILKQRTFYDIWLIYLLSTSASLLVIGFLGSIAKEQILWKAGFIMVVIISVSNFLGRIFGGILFDYIGFKKALLGLFILQIINLVLFWSYNSILLIIIGSFIPGFVYGAIFAVFPLITNQFFGTKNFGINYGLIFTGWGFAAFIIPVLRSNFKVSVGTLNIPHILAIILFIISLYTLSKLGKRGVAEVNN